MLSRPLLAASSPLLLLVVVVRLLRLPPFSPPSSPSPLDNDSPEEEDRAVYTPIPCACERNMFEII